MSGRDKEVVWEHGEKLYPGWRCKYCTTTKGGGGAEVVHCRHVPPNVREYLQRDLDRAKNATNARARERLLRRRLQVGETMGVKKMRRRLRCGVPWNSRERDKSTDRGWEQRGGAYERGGGSGSLGLNPLQRMLRRATKGHSCGGGRL
jgi:hypothetical protein